MELIKVEITGQAITARYGTLNTGDILRTDAEFAKHLVEDCAAAKYITVKPAKVIAQAAPVTRKRKAGAAAAPAEAVQDAAEPTTATSLLDAVQNPAGEDQGQADPIVQPAVDAATE